MIPQSHRHARVGAWSAAQNKLDLKREITQIKDAYIGLTQVMGAINSPQKQSLAYPLPDLDKTIMGDVTERSDSDFAWLVCPERWYLTGQNDCEILAGFYDLRPEQAASAAIFTLKILQRENCRLWLLVDGRAAFTSININGTNPDSLVNVFAGLLDENLRLS